MSHYYYLDDSMGKDFDVVFKRAQSFAARAAERLDDPTDWQFANLFERIFKTHITDPRPVARAPEYEPPSYLDREYELRPRSMLGHVLRELRSFAYGWIRTTARPRAEVRLHWDGLGRWVQRGPEAFLDPVNYVVRSDGREAIEKTFSQAMATLSGDHPENLQVVPKHQHPQRVVIDFTEKTRRQQVSWATFAGRNLTGVHIDALGNNLLEITLIHEIMHSQAYRLVDFFDDDGTTLGWNLVQSLKREEAYICAESFAILCLAAALADLKPVGQPDGYRYAICGNGEIGAYRHV